MRIVCMMDRITGLYIRFSVLFSLLQEFLWASLIVPIAGGTTETLEKNTISVTKKYEHRCEYLENDKKTTDKKIGRLTAICEAE